MQGAMQNRKFKLRVHYKKVGRAAWTSQLELARALEHAIRRSGLPYAVSEGFSPHMRISFAQALSVGIESEDNVFDILLTDYIAPDKCLAALKNASLACLEPLSCAYVDNKQAFEIEEVSNFSVTIASEIKDIKVPDKIKVVKKRKEKEFDVSKFLDGEVELKSAKGCTELSFALKNFSDGSLNPEIFVRELLVCSGLRDYQIINFKKL